MQIFFPERYLILSRAAKSNYEERIKNGLRSLRLDIESLVEKIYHSADIYRLSQPKRTDLQIGVLIRQQLISDLDALVPGGADIIDRKRPETSFES